MARAAPAKLDAGTNIALKVRASCPSGCDLRRNIARIIAQDGEVVKETELTEFDETGNETDEFIVEAPIEPGGYTWTAVFPAQHKEGVLHEGSSAPFSFSVRRHATSMAVWDVPSPIAFSEEFRIKVGLKCFAECGLAGQEIEVYDHEGAKVATATLGSVPWSGTTALCWAEVELEAPGTEGYYTWEVKCRKPDLELPHEETSYTFGFRTARQPDHVVTVEVIDKDTKTPIKNADVLLHPYRGYTDERGLARLMVAKGEYELYVSGSGKETFQTSVKVASDVAVRAELLELIVEDF